jgi:arachidonate 15-lipoxygenase
VVLLGRIHHTTLGAYPTHLLHNFVHDARVDRPLEAFQHQLASIEHTIEVRNRARAPYPFLLPSRIPQSINI